LAGNIFIARQLGPWGIERSVLVCLGLLALARLLLPLSYGAPWFYIAMTGLWGLGGFAVNSAQQARLAALEPPLTPASIALNTSCIYLGQAIGAALGGGLIAWCGTGALAWPAALLYFAAIALSVFASKRLRT
jgi:MFS transporter, DHA1 family, inner membrane transport protein